MTTDSQAASQDSYDDTPTGLASLWKVELDAAVKWLTPFHEKAEKIEKRYRDERQGEGVPTGQRRWNLYPSNVQTQEAMMYGKTPKSSVNRKFQDPDDDDARIAAEALERLLNSDIARPVDTYARALGRALKDRRLVGLGQARVYYRPTFKTVASQPAKQSEPDPQTGETKELSPEVPEHEAIDNEEVEIGFVYWRDQLWSPCRVHEEMRWWGQKVPMDRKQLRKRFDAPVGGLGDDTKKLVMGDLVPLNSKKGEGTDPAQDDPWGRADVWEIWSKERKCVYWYVEGFDRILDWKEDPLGLDGFWPFGEPLGANLHNGTTIPQPDFELARDLYNQVDTLTTRIDSLVSSVKVTGVYDAAMGESLRKMPSSSVSELIPVENWALHAERGGIKGRIDWFPLDQVVATIDKLREMRTEAVSAVYQITGMADITRGQQVENGTPGEASIKARFASVRMQQLQEEFAKFASELLRLKAEVIAKHFQPNTIIERSNIMRTKDAARAQQAVALLQSRYADYRIEVKSDALAAEDFEAKQYEAGQAVQALAGFLTAASPLATSMPNSMPFLLEMLQAAMANYRWFSSRAEGTLDRAIAEAQRTAQQAQMQPQQQQQQPDPKVQAQQLRLVGDSQKAKADMQKEQFKLQADLARQQAETQAKASQEANQRIENVAEARAKHSIVHGGMLPPFEAGPGGIP